MVFIEVPTTFVRDYTTPMGEVENWNRNRIAICCLTFVFSFLWLNGFMQADDGSFDVNDFFWASIIALGPGTLFALLILYKTKKSEPPGWVMSMCAFLCFLQSVAWIQWISNVIMDLLQVFGFITQLPAALLALTIIAWGNSLGDAIADTAMTKRGFGEMAITGTVAGPIFNMLVGLGLSMSISILTSDTPSTTHVTLSLYDIDSKTGAKGDFNLLSILPLTLLIAQFFILIVMLLLSVKNNYLIGVNWMNMILYFLVIIGLIIFSITEHVQPPTG